MPEQTIAAMVLAGIAVAALLLAGVAVAVARRALRAGAELSRRLAELEQQHLFQQQSISGLTAGAVGMDRRLRRAEAAEKIISDRQESIENQQAAEQPYGHAIRLVQQGAGARRLMEELGLSESEAGLLVRMHGLRDSA